MRGILKYLSSLVENVWNFAQRARAFMAQQGFKSWVHLCSVAGVLGTLLTLFGSVFKSGVVATVQLAQGVTDSPELFASLQSNPLVKLAAQSLNPFILRLQDIFGDFGGWFCWFFGLDWFLWVGIMYLTFWVMSFILRLVFSVIQAIIGLVAKVTS